MVPTSATSGSSSSHEDVVLHHVEFASDPRLDGTTTRRAVSFEGERLVLTAAPPVLGGPGSRASLIWERMS